MQFRVDEIIVPADRPRALDEAVVAELVESIAAIGLQCPPTVRQTVGGDVVLVCGAHRIAALQRLGIETVECTVFSGSEQAAMMWTLAENLHRGELSPIERARHIQRWIELAREGGLTGRKAEAALDVDHGLAWRSARSSHYLSRRKSVRTKRNGLRFGCFVLPRARRRRPLLLSRSRRQYQSAAAHRVGQSAASRGSRTEIASARFANGWRRG
jgi:ParB-like nuclease domain